MTAPNPFAQPAPAQPEQAANPFAQQQAAPAAPAAPNPFGQGVQTAPAAPQQQYAPQQAAPQAYAPTAAAQPANPFANPASGRPNGTDHMAHVQQTYAQPAQQQYAAPAGMPALNAGALASAPPPVIAEGKGPKLPDMYGRLVLIFPLAMARVPRNPQYITPEQRAAGNVEQDRLTATVVILDSGKGSQPGGTISWGGAPYALPPTPHTNHDPLPYVRKGMWINQSRLISQLVPFLPAGQGQPGGMVAGRLVKTGPEHNAPWYLEGADEQELALARTYLDLVGRGAYAHPLA